MQTITLFVKLIKIHEENTKQNTGVKQPDNVTHTHNDIHKIEVQFSRKIPFITQLDIVNSTQHPAHVVNSKF